MPMRVKKLAASIKQQQKIGLKFFLLQPPCHQGRMRSGPGGLKLSFKAG